MKPPAIQFIDANGIAHEAANHDARIVSLVPSITELVVDLGLANQLVGRTQWCIHPADIVDTIPTIGGTKKINLDKLSALDPTHVIMNIDENTREMATAIAEIAPNIIVTHPIDPRDNIDLYRLIGGIFKRQDKAESLCKRFEDVYQNLLATRKTLPEQKVLYLIWKDPWMTVSHDTYIARTLDLIHWKTIGDSEDRYPQITIDHELVANTDRILFSTEPFDFNQTHLDEFAKEYNCAPDKLLLIDGEMTSWYGSRAIQGLRYLRNLASTQTNP